MSHSCKYIRIVLIVTAIVASSLGFDVAAKRLSAVEAWARINPGSRAGSQVHRLAYEAPESAFYVFSTDDRGYIVASGDDCVDAVLAVVPEGKFDIDSLAPATRWMLDCYQQEIQYKSSAKTFVSDRTDIVSLYNSWTAIEPLMSCEWNQRDPYNMLCPTLAGERCVTGCVATAMAQIIRTIGYAKGSGKRSIVYDSNVVEFDYEATPIDFDNLLDTYGYYDTKESKTAVAQLMLACGLSVSMVYGTSESGSQSTNVAYALINNFGYDKNYTKGFSRRDYSAAYWESLIYTELLEGRPVYYSGVSNTGAHAFVVDGYRPEGLWHVNWGWGGRSNGYFRLPDLNPVQDAVVGDTSIGDGYNSAQYLVKSVPPSANPGVTLSEMSGSLSVVSSDVYYVYFKSNGNLLLNITLGALIVSENGNSVESWCPFWSGHNITSTGSIYHDSYNYDFSQTNLQAGKYRIYPAVLLDGSTEPVICDKLEGRYHYLNLTVDDNNRYVITNADISEGFGGHALYAAEINGETLYSGYSNCVSVTLVNNGASDFRNTVFFSLSKPGENTAILRKSVNNVVVPFGYNTVVQAAITAIDDNGIPVEPGTYYLSLTDSQGESLLEDEHVFEVSVSGSTPPGGFWYPSNNLGITNALSIPEYYAQGDSWRHIPNLYNYKDLQNVMMDVTFYPAGSNMATKRYVYYKGDLGYIDWGFIQPDFMIDLPFGVYDVCYSANYDPISDRRRVRIGQQFGDVFYLPVDESSVAVCHHPTRAYSGSINVPSSVTIDGKEYAVCQVNSEAFLGCRTLESLQLPASIQKIGRDAFIYCDKLQSLVINSDDVPFSQRNFVMAGSSVGAVYVPAASYDAYNDVIGNYHDVYASIEQISSAEVNLTTPTGSVELAVTPRHEAINIEFIVESAGAEDMPAAVVADVEFAGGKLLLHLIADHAGSSTYNIRSVQPGVKPATLTVNVGGATGLDNVDADNTADVDRMYDLHGRPAKDRRGLRVVIINGKAKVMKF